MNYDNIDNDIEFVTPENFDITKFLADSGHIKSMYRLGVHFFGQGNFVEAKTYLKRGVEAGCQKSERVLKLLLWEIEHGHSVDLGE